MDIAINFLKMIGIKVLRKKDNIKIFGNPNLKLKKNLSYEEIFKRSPSFYDVSNCSS